MAAGSYPHLALTDTIAEQAVLGSLIIGGSIASAIEGGLHQTDFSYPAHRAIYAVMVAMHQRGTAVDVVTLSHELDRLDMLDDIGSTAYLAALTLETPTSVNLEHYAWQVRRMALERRLGEQLWTLLTSVDGRATLVDEARTALRKMDTLVRELGSRSVTSQMVGVYESILNRITGEEEDDSVIDTGLHRLNSLLEGGLRRTDFVVIAARTGVGKTALASSICINVAVKSKLPCVIYSYEMAPMQLSQRHLSAISGVALSRIRQGGFTKDEFGLTNKLTDAIAKLADAPLDVVSASGMTIDDIVADVAHRSRKGPLGIVCIDYVQLVAVPERLMKANRSTQVGETTALAKQMAERAGCCVLGLSQLNRAVEIRAGEPQLSDLRESGTLEQDANQVIFVYDAPKTMQAGVPSGYKLQLLDLQKNRNGAQSRCQIFYHGALTRYQDTPHG